MVEDLAHRIPPSGVRKIPTRTRIQIVRETPHTHPIHKKFNLTRPSRRRLQSQRNNVFLIILRSRLIEVVTHTPANPAITPTPICALDIDVRRIQIKRQ